jgi:predicted lipid-binding transport protein (Tim44 family)
VFLVRRFLSGVTMPQPALRTEPTGWMPAPPPQANPVAPIAPAARDGGAVRLPPGFDLPSFLRESRLAFVRLQTANDRADIADLREFTTPQMFAELALAIQERQGATQQVEVVALDAQLLDLTVEQEEAVASVQFHGTAREDQGPPEAFTEIWHVRKQLANPRSSWLLAGIQQNS